MRARESNLPFSYNGDFPAGGWMISRREFFRIGGATAGVAAVSRSLAAFTESQKAEGQPLPRSLARLQSRKSEAVPITRQERAARLERARALMSDNALDAILLMEGSSLQYFAGIHWWGGERMFALVLPAKGNAFYVCPAFEEGRAREQIANAPDGDHPDVRTWQEDESPYQRLAQGLQDRGIASGKIGIEETVRYVFVEGMSNA